MLKRFLGGSDDESLMSVERALMVAITVVVIALIFMQLAHVRSSNRDQTRKVDLYGLQLAVQRYFAANGFYPASLTQLSGLSPNFCQDPTAGGNCQAPAYGYTAFAAGTTPSVDKAGNCDNHKTKCAGYILFNQHMETTANPFSLSSG